MRQTKSHFRVTGLFDGQHEATVTVDDTGREPLITVRPLHGDAHTMQLKDVAQMIHARCVKLAMPKDKIAALLPRRLAR